jgi:hypothetical protein
MIKTLYLLFCILFLASCTNTNHREKLVANIKSGNFASALADVRSKDFYPQKNSILLNKLEVATVYYINNDYQQSLKYFNEAEKISEELFTVSIGGKLKAIIDSDADNYYGEKYERLMIRFFKSLLNYKIYKTSDLTDEEKLIHLRSARSNIMELESLSKSYQQETAGKAVYKVDLLSKLWGAFIFEENGSQTDMQRALSMYRSAKDVLLKNYNIYPTFNKSYGKFEKNFNKLPNMNIKYVERDFIVDTDFANELYDFIDKKIDKITKNQKDNLVINFKENLIVDKKVKTVEVPLLFSYFTNQSQDFFDFIKKIIVFGDNTVPNIKIELPYVEERSIKNKIMARIFDENNQEVEKFSVVLVNPMSDIAFRDFESKKTMLYAEITTVVILKYVAALTATYQLYKSNGANNSLADITATISYTLAKKMIDKSSKADLRQWITLFDNVRIGSTHLKNGKYILKLYSDDGNKNIEIYSKNITISDETCFVDVIRL